MKYKFRAVIFTLIVAALLGYVPAITLAVESATQENPYSQLPSGVAYPDIGKIIDDYVDEHIDTTAAMSVSVFSRDSVIFEKSYGYTNIEDKTPNNDDRVIEWGSSTKLLVWVSAMQLWEQGLLDLNADIKTYLPDGFLKKLKYDDPITMIHLMNHTPGWQEVAVELFVENRGKIRDLENTLTALEPAQVYRPGEYVAYSNYGAALAGYIIERISGIPFYEYVHTNIFSPLDMPRTAIRPDLSDNLLVKDQRSELVCYSTDGQNIGTLEFAIPLYPAGMATGTISDFRKFGMALLPDENGESPLFRKSGTLAELYTPTKYFSNGTAYICHGLWTAPQYGGNVIGHGGNTAGCSSYLQIDPEAGVGTVIMTNQSGEGIYNSKMLYSIFGEREFAGYDSLADVSGVFTQSRAIYRGILSAAKPLMYSFPIPNGEAGSINVAGMTIECVENGIYKMSMDDSVMMLYAETNTDGQVQKLSTMSMELIRTSWGGYILGMLLLLCFVVSGVYGLVALIVSLIRRLRRKTARTGDSVVDKLRVAVCGVVFASIINFLVVAITVFTYMATLTSVAVNGILFILFALVPIAFVVVLAIRYKNIDAGKKLKRRLRVTAVMGLIMTLCIVFMQLWWFWA